MTGEEILKAIYEATPEDQGSTLARLCGPHEHEVTVALASILAAFTAGRFTPELLAALAFNLGVYCSDRGLASTIQEIQERRRQS